MMSLRDTPIRRKLIAIMLVTSGVVLVLTCAAFIAYEAMTFRQTMVRNLATIGEIIADNSTAALAFDNQEDAREVLAALKAERHVVAAGLYDTFGRLFATYPASVSAETFPVQPDLDGYRFEQGHLVGFQPVVQGNNKRLGTLYLKADLDAVYERLRLYGTIAALVTAVSFLVAYLLSRVLQQQISQPILALAKTAQAVSTQKNFAIRAVKLSHDEVGALTDSFNQMLTQIQAQLTRLELLNRITRATGERQDLRSIFQVVIRSLEDHLPIDFGCACLYDHANKTLTVINVGVRSEALAMELALTEQSRIDIDENGLSRCVRGHLVYEPDVSHVNFPFPQRLARGQLRSFVAAPLVVESQVFGVLVAARRQPQAFSSGECEFIRQLSEHVALAAHQAQLYSALQQAYDDLRQTQQTVMQQERLRALGQMASGIAHDINNALSPVALYAESLLERETALSEKGRAHVVTIQRAIEDVAQTVSRMREFYRQREPQMMLSRVELNRIVQQVVSLTHARWSDVPQERGIVIRLQTELEAELPEIMGAESEIRDALTNLVFNAVDAMPDGGTLTLRTRAVPTAGERTNADHTAPLVHLEVCDTGVGMDEETRRHCLDPFFTTKGERGTGLGLAMVYGMVQRHGAELELDSELGRGTTVRLVFPIAPEAVIEAVGRVGPSVPAQRLHILVVDDDPLLIQSLRDTLEGDGHAVTVADGGQKGIDAFAAAQQRGAPFAVVITDLGMPYVDGRKVAAAVKAAAPGTPVILLTGWGERLVAENDVPPHVDRVLSKPPKLQVLREALAQSCLPKAA
jgi:signal transduction histidine kinase/ActR/RegA family two-component response regulator